MDIKFYFDECPHDAVSAGKAFVGPHIYDIVVVGGEIICVNQDGQTVTDAVVLSRIESGWRRESTELYPELAAYYTASAAEIASNYAGPVRDVGTMTAEVEKAASLRGLPSTRAADAVAVALASGLPPARAAAIAKKALRQ